MIDMERIPIQQLWYTWSDVGLSSVHAGFRVRAASPDLTEIYTERVKSMDRYLRYVLPPGTNRSTATPETAPIGLSFLRTEKEAILVHKNYSGEDGVGRPGNFFVHLLALGDATPFFSVEDAIWLWDAELWKTDDKSLSDRRTTTLNPIPLRDLDSGLRFRPQFAQIHSLLPFFIEAFLTRKGRAPLYVAAPAHQASLIAYLIAGLANCLPRQLLSDLTFSTYEHDITKSSTDIVGTSWISSPGQDEAAIQQVLPDSWYRDHLAINCQTGMCSQLQGHSQITPRPLASDFAAYATECLVNNAMDQLYELCTLAEKNPGLTVDQFLQLYNSEIANIDSVDTNEIELYLNDPSLALDRLQSRNFRKKIVDRVRENPQWCSDRLLPILERLRHQAASEYRQSLQSWQSHSSSSQSGPDQYAHLSSTVQKRSKKNKTGTQSQKVSLTLVKALNELAKRAIPDVVDAMKKGKSTREIVAAEGPASKKKSDPVIALLNMMNYAMVEAESTPIWQLLFSDLQKAPTAISYLNTQWGIRFFLLQVWNDALPPNDETDSAIRPLVQVPWNVLGSFLSTFLKAGPQAPHPQWITFAIEKLLSEAPSPQVILDLEQNYAPTLSACLLQLIQEAKFVLAANFLQRLAGQGFHVSVLQDGIIESLFTNLSSQQDSRFWSNAKDLVITLLLTGYSGSFSYQERIEHFLDNLLSYDPPLLGYALLDGLIAGPYPRKYKLVACLNRANATNGQLYKNVQRVYRTPEELNTFFLSYGSSYLQDPFQHLAMINFYKDLSSLFPRKDKIERLFVCLDVPTLEDHIAIDILKYSPFERDEKAKILERYGQRYLKKISSNLAQLMVDWFVELAQTGYAEKSGLLFTILTFDASLSHVRKLLEAASLSLPEIQKFFRTYGFQKDLIGGFFLKVKISLSLFDQLSQAARRTAGTPQGKLLSEEKMALLFAWLDPANSYLAEGGPENEQVAGNILFIASLTEKEQAAFLEQYGTTYLALFPSLPFLHIAITNYMKTFTLEMLELLPVRSLLTTLFQYYKLLPLASSTGEAIQYWYAILRYYNAPSASPDALKSLTQALFIQNLPNSISSMASLAGAFVQAINTLKNLLDIMNFMQNVPGVQNNLIQFLYLLAEEAANSHNTPSKRSLLLPYLLYALRIKADTNGEQHFRLVFLDTLLYSIPISDLNAWSMLTSLLKIQPEFSGQALLSWQSYLEKLDVWTRLPTGTPTQQKKSLPKFSLPSWPFRQKTKKSPEGTAIYIDTTIRNNGPVKSTSAPLPPPQMPQQSSYFPAKGASGGQKKHK